MSVANLFQNRTSGATARTQLRIRRSLGTCATLFALTSTVLPGGAAEAQQNTALPMAPRAIAARLPDRPIDDLALPSRLVLPAHLALPAHPALSTAHAAAPAARFAADITVQQASPDALPLSLDDAIDRGLKHNLQILLTEQDERAVHGQISSAVYGLLPNMKATADTSTSEVDLAAMGFKPASLEGFGLPPGSFHEIVKVNTTGAQFSLNQILFSLPDFYLYAAAKKAATVVSMNALTARGDVVQAVATQYLASLADQSQIADAQALVKTDREMLRQATLSHNAGVGTHLDVLRAQVQLQSEQQTLLRAVNALAKDKIALNRLIGLPAGQKLTLTDTVPYAEYTEMPLAQARALAYQRRKDLLALQAQLQVAQNTRKAVKYERVPSLAFNGNYGVLGETHGLYHGVFTIQGTLKIPLFEEGRFRGESKVAAAQEIALRHRIDSLKATIDAQIRDSRLDVESTAKLVKVAAGSVALAAQALSDTQDRFAAGVDSTLPVVEAQSTLAAAQNRYIDSQFQFNLAKLTLALNTGVLESQYNQYLGR